MNLRVRMGNGLATSRIAPALGNELREIRPGETASVVMVYKGRTWSGSARNAEAETYR